MKVVHRADTLERRHYTLEKSSFIDIKPVVLYSGYLRKQKDWHENPHSHDFIETLFVIDGEGKIIVDGVERAVKRGDLVIYNAGLVHYEVSSPEHPIEAYFIAMDNIKLSGFEKNRLLADGHDFVCPTGDMYDIFKQIFSMLVIEASKKKEFYIEIVYNLSKVLLKYIFRLLRDIRKIDNPMSRGEAIGRIFKYIDANYLRDVTLDDIADNCFVNKCYTSHLFTKYEGMSMTQYINNKRVDHSKALLTGTELPISEVAEKSGFNDQGYYSRVFKKICGVSPGEYRKTNTKKPPKSEKSA